MTLPPFLRILLHALWTLGIIAFSVGAVASNWSLASDRAFGSSLRLRWFLIAKTDIPEGTRLSSEYVESRLTRLPTEELEYVSSVSGVVGKYTLRSFKRGERLTPRDLASAPFVRPPPGGAIIPVTVKSEHAGTLQAGMRLAFAKPNAVVPVLKEIQKQQAPYGFALRAVMPGPEKAKGTVLLVELVPCQTRYISDLAAADWVPVILVR